MAVGKVEAVKNYFNKETTRPVENREILELRKSMKDDEWEAFAKACAEGLGDTLQA